MPKTLQTTFFLWLSAYLPPLVWAGVIFLLSAQSTLPGFSGSISDFIFKKSAHIFVYGVLYLLIFRGVSKTFPVAHTDKQWFIPLLICFMYALTDEFHQLIIPGRTGTFRDVGFDMLGAFIVLLRQYQYI